MGPRLENGSTNPHRQLCARRGVTSCSAWLRSYHQGGLEGTDGEWGKTSAFYNNNKESHWDYPFGPETGSSTTLPLPPGLCRQNGPDRTLHAYRWAGEGGAGEVPGGRGGEGRGAHRGRRAPHGRPPGAPPRSGAPGGTSRGRPPPSHRGLRSVLAHPSSPPLSLSWPHNCLPTGGGGFHFFESVTLVANYEPQTNLNSNSVKINQIKDHIIKI